MTHRLFFVAILAGATPAASQAAQITSLVSSTNGFQINTATPAPGNADANAFTTNNTLYAAPRTPPAFSSPSSPLEYTLRVINIEEPTTKYRLEWGMWNPIPGGLDGVRVDVFSLGVSVPGLRVEPVETKPTEENNGFPPRLPAVQWNGGGFEGTVKNPNRIDFIGSIPQLFGRNRFTIMFGLEVPYLDDPGVETYDFMLRFTPLTPEPATAGLLAAAGVALLGLRRR